MALTAGTRAPIVPYHNDGGMGQSAKNVVSLPVANSEVIAVGDILTSSSGKMQDTNTDPTSVVGVAMTPKTAPASAGDSDLVSVILAIPGQLFLGTLVSNSTTDLTAPAYSSIFAARDFVEDPDYFFPLLDDGDTAGSGFTLAYARQQLRGANFKSGSGGTVNPRVVFAFTDTIFPAYT